MARQHAGPHARWHDGCDGRARGATRSFYDERYEARRGALPWRSWMPRRPRQGQPKQKKCAKPSFSRHPLNKKFVLCSRHKDGASGSLWTHLQTRRGTIRVSTWKSLLYARTTGYRCDYNHSKRTTGDFVHNSWGVNEPAIPLPGDRYLPEALTCTIHSSQAEFLRENGLVSWSCFPYQNRNRLRNAGVSRSRWDSEAAGVKRAEAGWGSGSGARTPLPRSWA